MMACVKLILFSAMCFLYGGMVCFNWECMQPKEQMLLCAIHEFALHHHEFGVWCAVSARIVGAGGLVFRRDDVGNVRLLLANFFSKN